MKNERIMFLEVKEKDKYINVYVCFLTGKKVIKKQFEVEPRFVTPRSKAYFYQLVKEAVKTKPSEATTLEDC